MSTYEGEHTIFGLLGQANLTQNDVLQFYPFTCEHTLKDLKAYINSNTVVVGDFNTPLSSIDRTSKQKINKDILDLKYTIDQIDLVDVYRTFHPTSTMYFDE
jgi:hypothetical protein